MIMRTCVQLITRVASKQLGYGAVIDHVGGKLSTFGEAASIPFAENDQIFDHRGEQKLSKVSQVLLLISYKL